MEKKEAKKLVFRIGEESVPMVMNAEEAKVSPFAETLSKAKGMVLSLMHGYDEDSGKSGGFKSSRDNEEKDFLSHRVKNNIVAFLGDRGSGKTSCLLSFKEVLNTDDDITVKKKADRTFFLPIVDPSFFDKEHNILEIVIGFIYREYDALMQGWERMDNVARSRLRSLQSKLSQVKEALVFLEKPSLKEVDDRLSSLATLSEGVFLVKAMHELVQAFLVCKEMRHLVISIDDLDLNVTEAFKMMEQIRKYLVLPNVVILLAAKFQQLHHSIEIYMTQHYKPILPQSISPYSIREMADRYLDKFIPLPRRIVMPGREDFDDVGLEIIAEGQDKPMQNDTYNSVHFAVLSLIYKKCGYLFYNYDDTTSLIIPDNLRELKAFISKIYSMSDRALSREVHDNNKATFKEYFYVQWVNRLGGKSKDCILTILLEKDITKINKTVVTLLYELIHDLEKLGEMDSGNNHSSEKSSVRGVSREIVNPNNYSENISIGDVLVMLDELRKVSRSSRIEPFLFFVTTYYSMKLYELYDEMTDTSDELINGNNSSRNNNFGDSKVGVKSFPRLKSHVEHKVPDYFKLVGNAFFTLKGNTLLPISSETQKSREESVMNGILLMNEFKTLLELDKIKSRKKDEEFLLRLNMIEFFVLCTSRSLRSDRAQFGVTANNEWRTEADSPYFTSFGNESRYILFNVTAPFVNTICPKYAYDRFDSRLYSLALKHRESLLNSITLKKRYKRDESVSGEHDLMSRMAIRNMEVLEDLYRWLITRRNEEVSTAVFLSDVEALKSFFSRFNYKDKHGDHYSVRTYEQNPGNGDYHTIEFEPLNVLYDFLNNLTETGASVPKYKEDVLKMFNRIYHAESHLAFGERYTIDELKFILRESGEADVLGKDEIITAVIEKSPTILADDLMRNLAVRGLYDKVLFTELWDDRLYKEYVNRIENDLNTQITSINTDIETCSLNSLKLKEDIRVLKLKIDNSLKEMAEIDGELASVKSGIDSLNTEIRHYEADIKRLNIEINQNYHMISRNKKRYSNLDKINDRNKEELEGIKEKMESGKWLRLAEPKSEPVANSWFNAGEMWAEFSKLQKKAEELEEFIKQWETESINMLFHRDDLTETNNRRKRDRDSLKQRLQSRHLQLDETLHIYTQRLEVANSIKMRVTQLEDDQENKGKMNKALENKKVLLEGSLVRLEKKRDEILERLKERRS